ncbi:MAG TPA: hypothetical protein VJ124_10690 [Pyrinomonadaceae bacterium]|nr:hypothetical protein [Pyrinomonadaceae bacterium]
MILQSQDDFDKVAELDRNTGEYRFLSKKKHPEIAAIPMSGGCSVVNGTMVCLYRTEGVLYLRVGAQEFKLTDDVTAKIAREDKYRVFELLRNGNLLVNFKYASASFEVPLELDPTPFIEDEDFDFFLFVHNVLKQTGRRQRVYN